MQAYAIACTLPVSLATRQAERLLIKGSDKSDRLSKTSSSSIRSGFGNLQEPLPETFTMVTEKEVSDTVCKPNATLFTHNEFTKHTMQCDRVNFVSHKRNL